MPFAKGGYQVCAVGWGEEEICDGCGMVMCGLGGYHGTAREGKPDVFWFFGGIVYCEECWLKAIGELPLDDVGPRAADPKSEPLCDSYGPGR